MKTPQVKRKADVTAGSSSRPLDEQASDDGGNVAVRPRSTRRFAPKRRFLGVSANVAL